MTPARDPERPHGDTAPISDEAEFYPQPEHGWTCFHCGETFTTVGGARDHFGNDEGAHPGCAVKVEVGDERGWLMKLRKLEAENARLWNDIHNENTLIDYHVAHTKLELASFRPFRECNSVQAAFMVYDSMEGRALAAEERLAAVASSCAAAPAQEPVGYAIVDRDGMPTTELWLSKELADSECVIFNGADNLKRLRPYTVHPLYLRGAAAPAPTPEVTDAMALAAMQECAAQKGESHDAMWSQMDEAVKREVLDEWVSIIFMALLQGRAAAVVEAVPSLNDRDDVGMVLRAVFVADGYEFTAHEVQRVTDELNARLAVAPSSPAPLE